LLHIEWRIGVGGVEKRGRRRVRAKTQQLRAQRLGVHGVLLGGPYGPMLPRIAASPAHQNQDAELIGQVEEGIGLHFPLQTEGVQTEVANQCELLLESVRVGPQQQIRRPSAAAKKVWTIIDSKQAITILIYG